MCVYHIAWRISNENEIFCAVDDPYAIFSLDAKSI